MTPLDLTARPPRPATDMLLGCAFLPRTIDKMRAELPGGNPGDYFSLAPIRTMTGYVLHRLGIDAEELRAVVAAAADEAEVVAWLRPRVDPALAADISAKIAAMRIDQMPPETQASMQQIYPILREHPEIETLFELFERDDAALLHG